MCFSATASFGAGILLSATAVVAMKKTKEPKQRVFAAIPLLFAVQQIAEGFVWLGLLHQEFKGGLQLATYIFLIFAQVVWALWIPLSLLLLEKEPHRKRILQVLLGAGIGVAIYHGYGLFSHTVTGTDVDCHIHYNVQYLSEYRLLSGAGYGLATIVPCFISGVKRMWWLGAAFLLSYIATQFYYDYYVVSIWCYFAALLSVIVIVILHGMNKQPATVA